jgi:hypothetical protein
MGSLRIIQPARNETYYVNDADEIYRCKAGGYDYDMAPSGQWRLLGAVEVRYVFGRWVEVRRYDVADIRAGRVPWRYKNGKQRCYLLDYDHGCTRLWSNPTPYWTIAA